MSSDVIIAARNLSKTYRAYAHPLDRFIPGRAKRCKEFHALSDISFDIKRGETVGIIGRNGSGKSTLLQLICGIRKPTSGTLQVNGRISALLELGAGFHPEFTGRENVFLQGAIQGMSRQEMEARFDDIAAFADIGEYIDQPVKTYSSGMFVRLAFAVAVSVGPDILVVDEALAVGDEAFQRKCFGKIEALKQSGATVLFVSHSAKDVLALCQRVLLMQGGNILTHGIPKLVLDWYYKLIYAGVGQQAVAAQEIGQIDLRQASNQVEEADAGNSRFVSDLVSRSKVEYGSMEARIENPRVLDESGTCVNVLERGRDYRYVFDVVFHVDAGAVRFGMMIKTLSGMELGGMNSPASDKGVDSVPSGTRLTVSFPFRCVLLPGTYFMNASVLGSPGAEEVYLHRVIDLYMFRVEQEQLCLQGGVVDFAIPGHTPDVLGVQRGFG